MLGWALATFVKGMKIRLRKNWLSILVEREVLQHRNCLWCDEFMITYDLPVQTIPPSRGGSQERAYLFYDRPSTHVSTAPFPRGQSDRHRIGCGTVLRSPWKPMKTAVRYQLRTQGRSPLQILPPNPSTVEGVRGDLSSSVQTIPPVRRVPA